ncbi:cation:proton antiporter [Spiribacter onubensis]|uniref:Cation:proton antiporter n=1 Tax=Spiribacter onubensis TaxID=3122420 RepID=A0ABV3SAW2_9GAMM
MAWEANATPDALLVLLVGGATLLAVVLRHLCERIKLPPLVGYILIGLGLRLTDGILPILQPSVMAAFELLAALGLVALLFRVGLGSDPYRLLEKLPGASLIWAVSVIVSGMAGYYAARWAGFDAVPALVAGVALTATSIGVSLPPWQAAGVLRSERGSLVLDVAELDDISGVVLMALLLSLIPTVTAGGAIDWGGVGMTTVSILASLAAFTAACWLFAHWLEPPLARFLATRERSPARMLIVVAIGSLIAALAGILGFSLAVGALFAGLVFSKAPRRVRQDRAYIVLYDFLAPFFFIGIGLKLEPAALTGALGAGGILLIAAVAGKLIGTALPALWTAPKGSALVIGMSMVPRAEIAMVVVDQAGRYGDDVVPPALYGAMTLVTLVTCAVTPSAVQHMLKGGSTGRGQSRPAR